MDILPFDSYHVNIEISDLVNPQIQQALLEFSDPSKLVLELLEEAQAWHDSLFFSRDMLDFIQRFTSQWGRVAIDDYHPRAPVSSPNKSVYLLEELLNAGIRPSYIKIDGECIRQLLCSVNLNRDDRFLEEFKGAQKIAPIIAEWVQPEEVDLIQCLWFDGAQSRHDSFLWSKGEWY